MTKPPDEAFDHYVHLGRERSHEAVAEKFDVTRRTVRRWAKEEDWAKRAKAIDERAQELGDKKRAETIAEMHLRHLKMLKAVQGRALKAVQEYPLTSGIQGMRMIEMAIKMERLIRAEPNERDQSEKAEELAGTIRGYLAVLDRSVPRAPEGD